MWWFHLLTALHVADRLLPFLPFLPFLLFLPSSSPFLLYLHVFLSIHLSAFSYLILRDWESLSVLEAGTLCYVTHFLLFVFSAPPPWAGSPASFSLLFHDTSAVDISIKFSNLYVRKEGKQRNRAITQHSTYWQFSGFILRGFGIVFGGQKVLKIWDQNLMF